MGERRHDGMGMSAETVGSGDSGSSYGCEDGVAEGV